MIVRLIVLAAVLLSGCSKDILSDYKDEHGLVCAIPMDARIWLHDQERIYGVHCPWRVCKSADCPWLKLRKCNYSHDKQCLAEIMAIKLIDPEE